MKHLTTAAAAAGLLLFSATVSAQNRPDDATRNAPRDSERSRVFDRLRADLDRVDTAPQPITADHARILKAREEVDRVERKVAEGNYNPRDFDAAVAAVQEVVDRNNLVSDSNREHLVSDLNQLKEFREHGEDRR